MNEPDDRDPWEQLSRQEKEEYQWEQHKKDLEELKRLKKEWAETAIRVNQFFQRLQTGVNHVRQDK